MKQTILLLVIGFLFIASSCKKSESESESENVDSLSGFTIKKGINISHWLSQSSARGLDREAYFSQKDVKDLAAFGFDHLRIPVDEEQMFTEKGEKIPEAFNLLHHAISWCEKANLKVIVDLHILRSHDFGGESNTLFTDPKAQQAFYNNWIQLSGELKKYPNSMVAYELMNESVADDHELWNRLVNQCIKEIRALEPYRTIVVGSNLWNSYSTVEHLKLPKDDKNLIVSFHYYEPFILTHYNAYWTTGVNYPGKVNYPGILIHPEDLEKQPQNIREQFEWATKEAFSIETIESHFREVEMAAEQWGVPVYCGEFGSIKIAPVEASSAWYKDVVKSFNKMGFAYAAWDFKGDFGIKRNGTYETDLIETLTGNTLENGSTQ